MPALHRLTTDAHFDHFETTEASTDALSLPSEVLDHTLALAYDFFKAKRYTEAAKLCQTLLVTDPQYWWTYSLFAAVLQRQGRFRECVTMINQSLRYEPGQAKLQSMKAEVELQLASKLEKKNTSQLNRPVTHTRNFVSTSLPF
jgi:predicted Zn-dependent protease